MRGPGSSTKYPLLAGVPIGAAFDYTINDPGNGSLTFSARYGAHTASATAMIPKPFLGSTVRFQAGAYQQADSRKGADLTTDGARVTFTALSEEPTPPGP